MHSNSTILQKKHATCARTDAGKLLLLLLFTLGTTVIIIITGGRDLLLISLSHVKQKAGEKSNAVRLTYTHSTQTNLFHIDRNVILLDVDFSVRRVGALAKALLERPTNQEMSVYDESQSHTRTLAHPTIHVHTCSTNL